LPAGKYWAEGEFQCNKGVVFAARLFNQTDGVYLVNGTTKNASEPSGDAHAVHSTMRDFFTITSPKIIQAILLCQNDSGIYSGAGINGLSNIYSELRIRKIGDQT
jgi:hypothetical protein